MNWTAPHAEVRDTAPSETEITLLPCGWDPLIGQECAVCCPHPSRAGTIPAIEALDGDDIPVQEHSLFMKHEQDTKNTGPNILRDALEITGGDRQSAYGSPRDNWTRTAKIAQAITGLDCLTPEVCVKVAMAMKQARLIQTPGHRDSMVDLAGYSWVLSEVMK